jgi:hypothetical protein
MNDTWTTSTYSGGNGCVETRLGGEGNVAVRDSKDPTGPALTFGVDEWVAFIDAVKASGL